jgi:hypothetical protein
VIRVVDQTLQASFLTSEYSALKTLHLDSASYQGVHDEPEPINTPFSVFDVLSRAHRWPSDMQKGISIPGKPNWFNHDVKYPQPAVLNAILKSNFATSDTSG